MNKSEWSDKLLPDWLKSPLLILLSTLAPQAILLAIHVRAYRLVSGDMNTAQLKSAFLILVLQLALMLGAAALVVSLKILRQPVSRLLALLMLTGITAYLWIATPIILTDLIPASAAAWILPADQLLYYEFAFTMPAAFHALVLLAGFLSPLRNWKALLLGPVLLVVAIPLIWVFIIFSCRFLDDDHWMLPMALLAIALSVIFLASLFQLIFLAVRHLKGPRPYTWMTLVFLASLAGPVGGLLLNREVPFPADFQGWPVYALAILNGLLLTLAQFPFKNRPFILWLAASALFPFTAYFFIIFLPFLPLACPAIAAMGAGFLVLIPVALFIIHVSSIWEGFGLWGKKAIAAALLASALMPGYLATTAWMDRKALSDALDYLYSSDPQAELVYQGNLWALKRSLYHLRDSKEGIQWPLLSDAYNRFVFGGKVLPDEKVAILHQTFFGGELPASTADGMMAEIFHPRVSSTSPRSSVSPEAHLSEIKSSIITNEGFKVMTLDLRMTNATSRQTEFAAPIILPEGVMASGFSLWIKDQKCPGRISDRNSALWIYRMIRDVTRRDPGILYFSAPHLLDLRVFPLEAGEERRVELEFTYPACASPAFQIGDRLVQDPGPSIASPPLLVRGKDQGSYVAIPGGQLAEWPSLIRKPYLHFIVDWSLQTNTDLAAVLKSCATLATRMPQADHGCVTLANYDLLDLADNPIPLTQLSQLTPPETFPRQGGFFPEKAIRHVLAQSTLLDQNVQTLYYPVVILVKADGTMEMPKTSSPSMPEEIPLAGAAITNMDLQSTPVILLRLGAEIRACSAAACDFREILFTRGTGSVLEVYHPASAEFRPVPGIISVPPDSRYAKGAQALLDTALMEENPALRFKMRPAILTQSRQAGILVPGTSYLVVESQSQWKALEQKEKQSLENAEWLQTQAAPEPCTWLLMILAGPLLYAGNQIRSKTLRS
ncbi:MAG: MSEP-CTERM sorting domain-containing protein [Lentisphaerota bacterium]